MIHFILLISRQSKVRLAKWFSTYSQNERARIVKDVAHMVVGRPSKLSNFLDFKEHKLVFKRYASLYFVACIDKEDNELMMMEMIHHFVEILDKYFGNVCELDLILNFHKAYFILDEIFLGGELQETSRKTILKVISTQDQMMEQDFESQFTF
ncbi:hypothetical protein C9374_002909 [Naegleria lovaniensis]|uniref:AP complex subunit sigma n=2 Tax=Naegleria TaxID=5761 RepID=A0AA88GN55_NAELO|nr:uncharacterized protein C9374_002909 [Naegleria lovaniensis]XP_044562793.1 uncharacterized protein FDP41_002595 [Naegleria fowleri]KAF0978080.1 hypothetical protein FDP41_002595 [Naegleria fowleri]KAG2385760.1 hypothetical protein C9374_002909 [Naegleria lovaniensis]CAG4710707.1 unnamed protein product [Naegleria fowleri]